MKSLFYFPIMFTIRFIVGVKVLLYFFMLLIISTILGVALFFQTIYELAYLGIKPTLKIRHNSVTRLFEDAGNYATKKIYG